MTNKELAAQCLIEAAELLDESAGRNGVSDRRYATSELNRLKNGETNEDDKTSDWYHGGREQRLKDLEKEARTGKDYRYGKPKLKGKDYLDERSGRQFNAGIYDTLVNGKSNLRKNHDLHELINQNAEAAEARKKLAEVTADRKRRYEYEKFMRESKNESVDIDALLEEAMDLLDY